MGIDFRRPKYPFGFRWGEALIWAVTGGKGISTLISGTPPLILGNALKAALVSLVQYGKVEQDDTPTPSAPVNIKCNNGVLKYGSGGIYIDGTDEVITISATGVEDQTAFAADLFAVGDYKDTQDIISGAVTRNVGIKVFDGTEDWTKPNEVNYFRLDGEFSDAAIPEPDPYPDASTVPAIICSHFIGRSHRIPVNDLNDQEIQLTYIGTSTRLYLKFADMSGSATTLKSWLAAQYAAGTPVIVLYPLATPTTETVTPQPLSTEEGDNTMTVTAEVSDIEFDVTYMANKDSPITPAIVGTAIVGNTII